MITRVSRVVIVVHVAVADASSLLPATFLLYRFSRISVLRRSTFRSILSVSTSAFHPCRRLLPSIKRLKMNSIPSPVPREFHTSRRPCQGHSTSPQKRTRWIARIRWHLSFFSLALFLSRDSIWVFLSLCQRNLSIHKLAFHRHQSFWFSSNRVQLILVLFSTRPLISLGRPVPVWRYHSLSYLPSFLFFSQRHLDRSSVLIAHRCIVLQNLFSWNALGMTRNTKSWR